jgi:deazaflavin-dependent oxidoreductase (nitroreductase family)
MAEAKGKSGVSRALQRAFEPIAIAFAGRRWLPLGAVIHHIGRRTGVGYATPVAVIPTNDKSIVLIGLPWGIDTNWALNVVAAGGARLTWRGRDHRVIAPRIIEPIEAVALAKPLFRLVMRVMPGAIALTRVP